MEVVDIMKQKICEKLIELRKNAGLTQKQLADELNITSAAISKWENGISTPDIEMLCTIADYFRISVDALISHTPKHRLAVLFLYNRTGESVARKVLTKHGIEVIGVVNQLTQLEELLHVTQNVDCVFMVALSDISEYVTQKVAELREQYHFKCLTTVTSDEIQIAPLLEMMLDQYF